MHTKTIGCDLGGTNLRVGIVNIQTGVVSHQKSIPTLAHEGHDAVILRMTTLIEEVIRASAISKEECH